MRISEMKLTPIAVPDPPLRNSWGIHEPVYMRVIIQLRTDNGLEGLGEAPGAGALAAALDADLESLFPDDENAPPANGAFSEIPAGGHGRHVGSA